MHNQQLGNEQNLCNNIYRVTINGLFYSIPTDVVQQVVIIFKLLLLHKFPRKPKNNILIIF